MSKRLFIAVELPADMVRELAAYVDRNAERWRGGRWVAPENLHITAGFLGDVEEADLEELTRRLAEAAAGCAPFELTFRGMELAPPARPPTMIWAVFDDQGGAFERLAGQLRQAAAELSPQMPGRKAGIAHVTLARFKNGVPGRSRPARLQLEPAAFTVRSCSLFESHLSSDGPTYFRLAELPLAAVSEE